MKFCREVIAVGRDNKQADWCADPWCYIDPCACDLSDPTNSDYFPAELHYSYATCEAANRYTETESATNTVGNAKCAGGGADESSSDAYPLKMGLGLLLASSGTTLSLMYMTSANAGLCPPIDLQDLS